MTPEIYNYILASLVLASQIYFVFVLVSFWQSKWGKKSDSVVSFVSSKYLWMCLAFSLAGLLGSLGYSEVIGYDPCKLCWLQRITLYPVVLLSAVALYKKSSERLYDYIIALMLIGSIIAVYHIFLQFVPNSVDCATSGQGVMCSKNWVLIYDYITIPVMSLTAHLNVALAAIIAKSKN